MAATVFHTYDNTLYEKVYQTAYQAGSGADRDRRDESGSDFSSRLFDQ